MGGVTLNEGRVQVAYDDIWSDVCYQYEDRSSRHWSFRNTQVVCRELGFPGAMFARQGGYGDGIRERVVYGYQCKEGIVIFYLVCLIRQVERFPM